MDLCLIPAVAVVIAIIVGGAMGRLGMILGILVLAGGLLPMVLLAMYESWARTPGDTSSYGMLATITAILAVPAGIGLLLGGAIRRE